MPLAEGFPLVRRCAGPAETLALGRALAERLQGGETILLWGELGAGKTLLVRGIAEGLGCDERVTSPTFNLAHRYHGRLVVHHLDLYRLGPRDDLHDIGIDAVLDETAAGGAVLLVEWPTPLVPWLREPLEMLLQIDEDPDSRLCCLRGGGAALTRLADLFAPREDSC